MHVVSICPLQVASLRWQPRAGSHAITVVCKATFVLRAGQSELAEVQDYPNDEDNHWNDDPNRSLYSASDLAPFKPEADIMLVGDAFAPEGRPGRSVVTRLHMGSIDKAIEVVQDRHFDRDGALIDGKRFARMSLRYERSAGGARSDNPVGINPNAEPDELGRRPVPNLLPAGASLRSPDDPVQTVGYGPVAPSWPSRRELLGRHAASWSQIGWPEQPLPEDIDPAFFNAAPSDQRTDEIRSNERIVLENLHPEEPRLVCHLPGIRPRAFVERPNATRELAMHADTLWIDTTRCICTVTWRGRVDLAHTAEQGRVLVAMERPGQELSWSDVSKLTASTAHEPEPLGEPTNDVPRRQAIEEAPIAKQIAGEHTEVGSEFTAVGIPVPLAAPLPFVHNEQAEAATNRAGLRTQADPAAASAAVMKISPEDRSPAWLNQSAIYQPRREPMPPTAPGPAVRGESYAPPLSGPASGSPPASVPESARPDSKEIVELIWYAQDPLPELREHTEWAALLSSLRAQSERVPEPQRLVGRREVVAVMTQASTIDAAALPQAMLDAVDSSGSFSAPLVLLSGRLSFPFDELEIEKVRASFQEGNPKGDPAVDPSTLDEHIERILLERRCYKMRTVFGGSWIRASLTLGNSKQQIPSYLPAELCKELPMFTSFAARMIAQAHVKQDQYESHEIALKLVALSRVIHLSAH